MMASESGIPNKISMVLSCRSCTVGVFSHLQTIKDGPLISAAVGRSTCFDLRSYADLHGHSSELQGSLPEQLPVGLNLFSPL